jgi:D,D-heptose 1,7-bisphosphate phosphatase
MSAARQIVILVGGKGTRLGAVGQSTPKPLMPIDDETVFLDHLLTTCTRQQFDHVILLAGHLGDQVEQRYAHRRVGSANIDVFIESQPLGTGGALHQVSDHLADTFLLLNGDTLFDTNLRALDQALQQSPDALACIALREIDDVGRYGLVDLNLDGRIAGFIEKPASDTVDAGLINGGIYALRRDILQHIPHGNTSIETDVFPKLAVAGKLLGIPRTGYFLDIGLPETLATARAVLPHRRRPVLFLDRDGVANIDHGHVGTIDRWEWMPGAKALIRAANDRGVAVVIITNQAGIAKSLYDEADFHALQWRVQRELAAEGAFVDGVFYCPDHPEAVDGVYRIPLPIGRKPDPVMLLRALRQLQLDPTKSLFVGDQPTDRAAAEAAGIPFFQFIAGNLHDAVTSTPAWDRLGWD